MPWDLTALNLSYVTRSCKSLHLYIKCPGLVQQAQTDSLVLLPLSQRLTLANLLFGLEGILISLDTV